MAVDVDEVLVAGTGHLHVAPVGTAGPTNIATPLNVAFVDLGYISEDGLSMTPGKDIADINAWQAMYPIRKIVTGKSLSITAQFLQWNKETFALAFDGGSWQTAAGVHTYTPAAPEDLYYRAVVADWTDGDKAFRMHWPKVMVGDVGEITLARSEASPLELTFELIATDGVNPFTQITDDPAFATV